MIEIEKQLFDFYSSLEHLESLDKHYYKKENFNIKDNRRLLRCDIIDSNKYLWFTNYCNNIHKFNMHDLPTMQLLDYMYDRVGLLDIITSYRYTDSFRKKTTRLRNRINRILTNDNLFFITFTFDDDKFRNKKLPSQKTLRKYVLRWLESYTNDFVGNVDFGAENGRIHFHCVCSLIESKVNHKTWTKGAINFKVINNKNDKALSLYVNKLCSHALKESTKNQYLLYPKKIS